MPQSASWPNGKRTAVLVSVLFESWSEGRSPSYFPRTTPLKAGATDYGGLQWAEYAGREGIWRLTRVLQQYDAHAKVFCSGRSGEIFPDAVKHAAKQGHDIAGHGYVQNEVYSYLTKEEQRERTRKTLDILEPLAGKRPNGWATAVYGWNDDTFDMLVEEGVTWYADALNVSLPRKQKTATGAIWAMPWSDFVDNRVLRGNPRNYFDVYKDTFDYLHANEPMSLVHVAIHSHFGGRPLMAAILAKTLGYFRGQKDVWFPKHVELLKFMDDNGIDEMPYSKRFFAGIVRAAKIKLE